MNTFGPELDAELAYRREGMSLRGPEARRGRGWLARLLRNGDDPSLTTGRTSGLSGPRAA